MMTLLRALLGCLLALLGIGAGFALLFTHGPGACVLSMLAGCLLGALLAPDL